MHGALCLVAIQGIGEGKKTQAPLFGAVRRLALNLADLDEAGTGIECIDLAMAAIGR
jgi:hypothetical protein